MSGRAALAIAIGAGIGTALLIQYGAYYLRGGWFWPLPWLVGGVVTGATGYVLLRRNGGAPAWLVFPLVAYATTIAATERFWFTQRSLETRRMTWEVLGIAEDTGGAGVRLYFVDHPSHFTGIQSAELARQLTNRARDTVIATFRVTRDLGCLRGTSPLAVDGWPVPPAAGGYAGRDGPGEAGLSPWGGDPVWCR